MIAVEEWFEEALMEACGYDDYCEPDAPTFEELGMVAEQLNGAGY
jgi:hypothetical protein